METINIESILRDGPTRYILNEQMDATSPALAAKRGHKVQIDIIFVRNDGWTLGAPNHLAQAAYNTWPKEWVGFIEDSEYSPISEYVPR